MLHRLADEVYRDLGFPTYEAALVTRPAARAGDDATWEWSEAKLGDAGAAMRPRASINPGEGAFYGPKLEFAWRVNGGAGDGHRRRMRNEGRPGKPARARRLTGRRSAHRAASRLQARVQPGALARPKHATVWASVGVAPSKRFEHLRDEYHAQPFMTQFPGILPRAKSIASDGANDRVSFAQNAQ